MSTQSGKIQKSKVTKDESGELSTQDQKRLEKARAIIEGALRKQGSAIFAVGKALHDAKKDLRHGTFLDWVDENLPFRRRSAQMYMRIFDVLFEHERILGIFQLSTLSALSASSLDAENRLAVIADIDNGALTTDEVVLDRIAGLSPIRVGQSAEVKAQRNAAREQLAKLTYEIAGDRLSEFIGLFRAAGLNEFANMIEDLATDPDSPDARNGAQASAWAMEGYDSGDEFPSSEPEADPLPDFLPGHSA